MGYDVHITRADDWGDSESYPIEWDEWIAVVEDDPELCFSDSDFVTFSGQPADQPMVVWDGVDQAAAVFYWFEGRIVTKDPSPSMIDKMVQVAVRLNAVVQGDDGERYPLDEDSSARNGCLNVVLASSVGLAAAASAFIGVHLRFLWLSR